MAEEGEKKPAKERKSHSKRTSASGSGATRPMSVNNDIYSAALKAIQKTRACRHRRYTSVAVHRCNSDYS
jgi:hypothetical protein